MKRDLSKEILQSTKEDLNKVSSSFCLAKWLQTTLHLHNGNTQSCHHVKSHQVNPKDVAKDPLSLHNTKKKLRARKMMLAGKRPSECSYCWTAEDRGKISDRTLKSSSKWANPYFTYVKESGIGENIVPTYVEVSFDSTCNFRCMYCSPAYSSSWMAEIKAHGPYPTSRRFNNLTMLKAAGALPLSESLRQQSVRSFFKWWPELSQRLTDFRITGGEPLLAKESVEIFSLLKDNPRPNLNLAINSNLGLKRPHIQKLIDQVNQLEGRVRSFTLFTSIDCVGEQAEYIRDGLNYNEFLANVELILRSVNWPITLSYMITVNALSLSGLKDLLKIIHEQRLSFPGHKIFFDTPYLQNPEHLSVKILPVEFVQFLDNALEFMNSKIDSPSKPGFFSHEITKVERIRSLISQPDHNWLKLRILRRDFAKMIDEYDRRRQKDFSKVFPEYLPFKNLCHKWI